MHRCVGLIAAASLAMASCAARGSAGGARPAADDAAITAAVAFYPIGEVVRRVGGDAVRVLDLTPAGGEPHDLELTAKKVTKLESADIVFYLGKGFQPAVQRVVDALDGGVVKIDLLDSVDLLPVTPQLEGTTGEVTGEVLDGNIDPHVWVDPLNMVRITDAVATQLARAVPAQASEIAARAGAYDAELRALDDEFSTALAHCRSRTIVTSHRAFGYLAHRYGLHQIPIAGISPDAEPDPKSMEAIAAAAKADGVTTVFFEERVPPALADTIAHDIGATTDVLDPVETIVQDRLDAGASYISIQQRNLASLVKALRCT